MRQHLQPVLFGLCLCLCLGVIAAASPVIAEGQLETDACITLSLNDCRDLIDANKVVGADAGVILRAAAQSHLDQSDPDEAILFLTVAESRDPNSALTQKLWGDAYVMRGEKGPPNSDQSGQLQVMIEFVQATSKYASGLGIDPDSQANFKGAVGASIRTGSCELPRMIEKNYASRFYGTDEAKALENFIEDNC